MVTVVGTDVVPAEFSSVVLTADIGVVTSGSMGSRCRVESVYAPSLAISFERSGCCAGLCPGVG